MEAPFKDQHINYLRISKAIKFLANARGYQPNLTDLAKHVGLSEFHLQRLFSQWVGISPKQFVAFLTQQYAKDQLQQFSVLQAAINSGLSGSSRLHDLMIRCEGITPGEYKKQGEGVSIVFGIHQCPFAWCLLANTHRGICKLAFFDERHQAGAYIDELKNDWPNADITHDDFQTDSLAKEIFERTFGKSTDSEYKNVKNATKVTKPLHVLLKGTDFQIQVWQALLSIPEGKLCSYQQVAGLIGKPQSVRAVASAIAKNNVGFLIPCHRVIKSTGDFNLYRWGSERKKAMLITEQARILDSVIKCNN